MQHVEENRPNRPNLKLGALMAIMLLGVITTAPQSALNAAPATTDEKAAQKAEKAKQATEKRKRLFEKLKTATSENEGRRIEFQIWEFWLRNADITSRTLVMDAMSMRTSQNFDHAMKLLNTAIKLKPDYAEAYNQRSFMYFLLNDYEKSLSDSRKALELEPKHFGALAGQAQIFFRQGRVKLMQSALRRAVKIHPWLKERHMLPENEQPHPVPKGQPL